MTEQRFQVFISSTFNDLQEQRKAVIEAILMAGAIPIAIESVGASDESAQDVVRRAVEQSDAVVMLIGHRYGAIEPQTGVGWLEREYEFALSRAKPLLVFMAADDAQWPASFVDKDRSRIEAFRRKVSKHLFVHSFYQTGDLRAAATNALIDFFQSHLPSETHRPNFTLPTNRREVRIVRMLLSSPGDVADERERVAKAVFRFNQVSVEERGLFVKLVRWEDMAPQIGPSPQEVINKQIGAYHLFCGLMWNRFGTPTEIAASGTKEEFDGALSSWESNRKPWVTFYFCERASKFTTPEQIEQKGRVLTFRSGLGEKGILRFFEEAREFEEMVYGDLRRITELHDFLKMLDAC